WGVLADRQRRRRPDLAGLLVAEEDGLSRSVANGIVRPGRELVLATVARPRESGSGLGHEKAEAGVRDHVRPWSRRVLSAPEDRHVFAGALVEAAEAVPEAQLQTGRRRLALRRRGRPCRGRAGCRPPRQRADDLIDERRPARQDDASRRREGVLVLRRHLARLEAEDVAA